MPLTKEHSVFILGAGCSKTAGAPLMNEFMDQARNLYFAIQETEDRASFDRVFEAIGHFSRVHSKAQLNLVNLETVFSAFEMARLLGKIPGGAQKDADRLISDLKRVIVVTLERCIKLNYAGSGHLLPTDEYVNLADLLAGLMRSGKRASIITFNYDVLCELAFENKGLNLRYCLTDSADASDPKLLKLHGSLNWAVDDENKEIIPQQSSVSNFFESRGPNFRVNVGTMISRHKGFESSPFLVPPTWNKGDHYRQIQPVWRAAAQELASAHNILVIGFSMPETDSFFHYLYALGSESREQLRRFCVFNPDERVMERFRKLLGPGALERFQAFSGEDGKFASAINRIKRGL
jgi:hypothetical protein